MKLDFEQRREAIELEEWVTDHPNLAAAQIVSLRSECQRLRDEIEVALASAPADGYKLVPVEPTEAMTDALRGRVISDADSARRVYAGLIAAAPTDGRE